MKIAIVGPGAMGRLLAGHLAKAGHVPLLIARRAEQVKALRQAGLTFVEQTGTERRVAVAAALELAELPDVDGVIITVKSYDTQAAGRMLRHLSDIPMLSLQNGLGNAEILAESIGSERLAIGLTTQGATAEGDTVVFDKGSGQTIIGDWVSEGKHFARRTAKWWVKLLSDCALQTTWTADIRTEIWRKAMINIGINPFTALWEVQNGELLAHPELLLLMKRAVAEAEAVAAAEGVQLADSFSRVLDVCRMTAQNRSSMLQDRLRGRNTEIDALCGVIVRLGRKHRIATPVNRLLFELVAKQSGSNNRLNSQALFAKFREVRCSEVVE